MPFRTKEMLEQWVREFEPAELSDREVDVLRHDDGPESDTGLIVVRLSNASTEVYLHPTAPGEASWEVHFAPRDEYLVLDATGVQTLSDQLARASALCAFLEERSRTRIAADRAGSAAGAAV